MNRPPSNPLPSELVRKLLRIQFPSLPALTLYVVNAVTCIRMCFWQMRRAREKSDMLEARRASIYSTAPIREWFDPANPPSGSEAFRIEGWFDEPRSVYSPPTKPPPNVKTADVNIPGHYVYTPFYTTSGQIVLVNRGWLPLSIVRARLETALPARSTAPTPNPELYAAQLAAVDAATTAREAMMTSSLWRRAVAAVPLSAVASLARSSLPPVPEVTVPPPTVAKVAASDQGGTSRLVRWSTRLGITPISSPVAHAVDQRGVIDTRAVGSRDAAQYRMHTAVRPRRVLYEVAGLEASALESPRDALRTPRYVAESAPHPPTAPDGAAGAPAALRLPRYAGVLRALPTPTDEPKVAATAQFPLLDQNLHVYEDDDDDARIATLRAMSHGSWEAGRTSPLPKAAVDLLTHQIMPETHMGYAKFWAASSVMPVVGWALIRGLRPRVNAPFYAKPNMIRYKSNGRLYTS